MTSPVIILGCGAKKRGMLAGRTCPIVELYTGPLYLDRLAYARALGGPTYVLSGLHGLRRPEYLVGTYEHDLAKQSKRDRDTWADQVANDIERSVPRDARIVALASGPYLAWTRSLASRAASWGRQPYTVEVPGAGLGIGEQRRCLRALTATALAENDEREPSDEMTPEAEFAEVLRELPTWSDDEEVILSVAALRLLLASAGRVAA